LPRVTGKTGDHSAPLSLLGSNPLS
jgi:hypothetical protein